MVFPPKIHIICFQNFGQFRARLAIFDTDVSQWRVFSRRLVLVVRIFFATFFYDLTTFCPLTQPKTSEYLVPELKV